MKQQLKDWGKLIIVLLDEILIIALILIILRAVGVELAWPVITGILIVVVGFVFLIHRAVFASLHRKKVAGMEGLIGQTAIVVAALKPKGTVMVEGELWKAATAGDHVAKNEKVEVLAVSGLMLRVRRVPPGIYSELRPGQS